MVDFSKVLEFYKDKKVFVTGHTGFKGSWLCHILLMAGAKVTGYSLEPPTSPSLFELAGIAERENMTSIIGDVRDYDFLKKAFDEAQPDVVIHLAAQPLVIDSYKRPQYTYETNVMGSVNLLECVRQRACREDMTKASPLSFLNVTTDKVYKNDESGVGFVEDMPLDGFDPYSNSKSCSELVTHSYRSAFLEKANIPVSTARAGNVIGGGDFSENRIVPDCVRAALGSGEIVLRNPFSVRPYQHVIEPLFAYLMIAMAQYENHSLAGAYNVGPDERDCVTTGRLAQIFCESWNGLGGNEVSSRALQTDPNAFHEAGYLRLDCKKLKTVFGWQPVWDIETAIKKTVEWSIVWDDGNGSRQEIMQIMDSQVKDYIEGK